MVQFGVLEKIENLSMMAEDVLMTLPNEIIEIILINSKLSIQDVANFAFTCKHLYNNVMSSNNLWKAKFFQRWPHLKEIYTECEKQRKVKVWSDEVKFSIQCRKKLLELLSLMSTKYYKKQELAYSEFEEFDPLFRPDKGAHPLAYYFLLDELLNIIECPVTDSNLTTKYYAKKVIRYIKQNYLTDEWHRFIELPLDEQLLEQGAVLVAEWSQPEKRITYARISAILDEIVEKAKEELKERYPGHSIFSTSADLFNKWKKNNISDHQWSIEETKQIMAAICEVIFKKFGFQGSSDYYDAENSYIDVVLERKQGIPMTLAIIFESVSRRVGVKCEPIILPSHFLLRWKEKYTNISDTDEIENFYIDVFNEGRFLTRRNCPRLGGVSKCPIDKYNIQNASTVHEIVDRMANNLETAGRQRTNLNGRAERLRSALELIHLVRPYDTRAILLLGRFYMSYSMDLTKLIDVLSYVKKEGQLTSRGEANGILRLFLDFESHPKEEVTSEIKNRTPNVRFAIGMIMKHTRYNYFCVITGWDERCEASPQWIEQMGVEELDGGTNQPFYNVFAEDGSCRYAAQENLTMARSPAYIDHFQIGRYFCRFMGTHYEPNEEKSKEYPEDAEVRETLIQQHYL